MLLIIHFAVLLWTLLKIPAGHKINLIGNGLSNSQIVNAVFIDISDRHSSQKLSVSVNEAIGIFVILTDDFSGAIEHLAMHDSVYGNGVIRRHACNARSIGDHICKRRATLCREDRHGRILCFGVGCPSPSRKSTGLRETLFDRKDGRRILHGTPSSVFDFLIQQIGAIENPQHTVMSIGHVRGQQIVSMIRGVRNIG